MPGIGRRDIALDWAGRPRLVIEALSVAVRRFHEVDEAFALADRESGSLEGWRRDRRAHFERNGGWSPRMARVCARFRVVERLEG